MRRSFAVLAAWALAACSAAPDADERPLAPTPAASTAMGGMVASPAAVAESVPPAVSPVRKPVAPGGHVRLLNALCPGHIAVHADEGGPVFINGKEARLKIVNDHYYEASDAGSALTISVASASDGMPEVSYAARARANGVCTVR